MQTFAAFTLLTFLMSPSLGWAKTDCKNIDKNSIVLFLDLNGSHFEVQAATEAACKQGYKTSVMPQEWKKIGKFNYQLTSDTYVYNDDLKCQSNPDRIDCQKLADRMDTNYDRIMEALNTNIENLVSIDMLDLKLSNIHFSGAKVVSLVISGHHTAEKDFYGILGGLRHFQIIRAFRRNRLSDTLKSVYLWGCNTSKENLLTEYKAGFPNVNIIAGYHAKAPANITTASPNFLGDVMSREHKLMTAKDQKTLEQIIKLNIRNFDNNGALWIRNPRSSNKDYYFRSGYAVKALTR